MTTNNIRGISRYAGSNRRRPVREIYRTGRARFALMSWPKKLLFAGILVAISTLYALTTNGNLILAASIGLGISLLIGGFLSSPKALLISGMLLIYIPLSLTLGILYSSAPSAGGTLNIRDVVGGEVSLIIAAAFATFFGLRYSLGRPWVTVLLTLISTITLGYVIVLTFPNLGLYAAYIAMAVVVIFRCGIWAWVLGVINVGMSKAFRRKNLDPSLIEGVGSSVDKADRETSTLLKNLSSDYFVFHDLKIGRHQTPLTHMVVGPQGVTLLASLISSGSIVETAKDGLKIPGNNVTLTVSSLLQQQKIVSRKLKIRANNIHLALAVYPNKKTVGNFNDMRRDLAVFAPWDGELPSGKLVIVGSKKLQEEITTGTPKLQKITRKAIRIRVLSKFSSSNDTGKKKPKKDLPFPFRTLGSPTR